MGQVNRSTLVREAGTVYDDGTPASTTYTIVQLDMAAYKGYNHGASGKYAYATLDFTLSGVRGSDKLLGDQCHGEWVIHLRRGNAGAPAFSSFADANNVVSGVTFDISGTIFRCRIGNLASVGSPTVVLGELAGVLVDVTP